MQPTNQRNYTRLPIDVMVELQLNDDTRLYGETTDLSLDGAFVALTLPPEIESGQPCSLVLILNTEDGWVRVVFASTIAHSRSDGIGIRFDGASLNHHESFLKLLIDGASDVDKLLDELSQHPRKEFQFTDQ